MKNLIGLVISLLSITFFVSCNKSIDTLIKKAEQGDAETQCDLGLAYANGQGVTQDYISAYMWYDIAASNAFKTAVD